LEDRSHAQCANKETQLTNTLAVESTSGLLTFTGSSVEGVPRSTVLSTTSDVPGSTSGRVPSTSGTSTGVLVGVGASGSGDSAGSSGLLLSGSWGGGGFGGSRGGLLSV